MTDNHWDTNLAIIDQILSSYPHVLGLQIMNDQGAYMFDSTKGQWLNDSVEQRAEIRRRAKHWAAFSQSNPVPGMEEAIRTYWAPDKRISVFVLGDEFTGKSIQAALDSITALNKPGPDGRRPYTSGHHFRASPVEPRAEPTRHDSCREVPRRASYRHDPNAGDR